MEKIIEKYLGIKNAKITKIATGTQNEVYNVDDKYLIKVFNKDAISNEHQREIRENKEIVAQIANQHGINAILPYKFNRRYVQKKGIYFVIYPYVKYKAINRNNISNEHIESLAKVVTKLHDISIDVYLPNTARPKFNIDFNGWHIDGDFFEWDYNILDPMGKNVATVSKQIWNWTDTYVIDVADPRDSVYALMLVLAIDAEKCSR